MKQSEKTFSLYLFCFVAQSWALIQGAIDAHYTHTWSYFWAIFGLLNIIIISYGIVQMKWGVTPHFTMVVQGLTAITVCAICPTHLWICGFVLWSMALWMDRCWKSDPMPDTLEFFGNIFSKKRVSTAIRLDDPESIAGFIKKEIEAGRFVSSNYRFNPHYK